MSAPAMDVPAFTKKASAPAALQPRRDAPRNAWPAIGKGIRGRCPARGEGKMFRAYLKINGICPHCGEDLRHHRADNAPPYMTIFVGGHIVGSLMLLTGEFWPDAPVWLHAMVWPASALILSLWILPIMKGGLIAYQWALRMHGFENAGRTEGAIGQSKDK